MVLSSDMNFIFGMDPSSSFRKSLGISFHSQIVGFRGIDFAAFLGELCVFHDTWERMNITHAMQEPFLAGRYGYFKSYTLES